MIYVYTSLWNLATENESMRKACTQFEKPTIFLFIIFLLFFNIFFLFLNLSPFSLMREDLILWLNWTGSYDSQTHSNPCLCYLCDGITGRRHCSLFHSVAIKKHWPKEKCEGKDCFSIQHWTQGMSLKAGTTEKQIAVLLQGSFSDSSLIWPRAICFDDVGHSVGWTQLCWLLPSLESFCSHSTIVFFLFSHFLAFLCAIFLFIIVVTLFFSLFI